MLADIEGRKGLARVKWNRRSQTDRIHIRIVQYLIVVCVKPECGIVLPWLERLGILITYRHEFDFIRDTGRVDKCFSATGADDGEADWFFGCVHLVA